MPPPLVPRWVVELQASLVPYAIPFLFGPRPQLSRPAGISGGLCVAIDFGENQYLITADHVIEAALTNLTSARRHCVAGPVELALADCHLNRDQELDLATVEIDQEQMATLEAEGFRICRPTCWPPPNIKERDPLVLVGAPKQWKLPASWSEVEVGIITVAGLATNIGPHQFVCQLDPQSIQEFHVDGQNAEPVGEFSGSSGGPVFLIDQHSGVLVPHFCGIVREEAIIAQNRFVYVSRVTLIRPDGRINEEMTPKSSA